MGIQTAIRAVPVIHRAAQVEAVVAVPAVAVPAVAVPAAVVPEVVALAGEVLGVAAAAAGAPEVGAVAVAVAAGAVSRRQVSVNGRPRARLPGKSRAPRDLGPQRSIDGCRRTVGRRRR